MVKKTSLINLGDQYAGVTDDQDDDAGYDMGDFMDKNDDASDSLFNDDDNDDDEDDDEREDDDHDDFGENSETGYGSKLFESSDEEDDAANNNFNDEESGDGSGTNNPAKFLKRSGTKRKLMEARDFRDDDDDDDDDYQSADKSDEKSDGLDSLSKSPSVKKRKSSSKGSRKTRTTGVNGEKVQRVTKQQRTEKFKTEKEKIDSMLRDVIYIYGICASGICDNFDKQILEYEPDGDVSDEQEFMKLKNSFAEIMCMVHLSLDNAVKFNADEFKEMKDLTCGALQMKFEKNVENSDNVKCSVTNRTAKSGEKLVLACALHTVPCTSDPNGTKEMWKRRVVLKQLQPLLEALFFLTNMKQQVINIIDDRMRKLTTRSKNSTAHEALEAILNDTVKHNVFNQVKTRLRVTLDALDLSARKLK